MNGPSAVLHWCIGLEGSTRAIGLLRIVLALLIWSRWAREIGLFAAEHAAHVLLAVWFFPWTFAMVIGFHARLATAMTGLCLVVVYVIFGMALGHTGWTHHHTYLLAIATVLLAFTPCDRSFSLDRWRALERARRENRPPPPEHGPLWGQRLIGLQLSAIYFWTAVDKTEWAFLSGERLEQTLVFVHAGRPLFDVLTMPGLAMAASVLVVVIEYALAVAIHIRRAQAIALPVGIGLHLAFYLLLPVSTYSATMICLYLVLLDPDAVHRVLDRLQGYANPCPA